MVVTNQWHHLILIIILNREMLCPIEHVYLITDKEDRKRMTFLIQY